MEIREIEKFNGKEFIGREVSINSAEVISTKFGLCLKVESEPLKDNIRASVIFSFGKDESTDEYFIVKDSKLEKFIAAHDIPAGDIPGEIYEGLKIMSFIGKRAIIQINSKSGFMEII